MQINLYLCKVKIVLNKKFYCVILHVPMLLLLKILTAIHDISNDPRLITYKI